MPTEPSLTIEAEPDEFEFPPIRTALLIIDMPRDLLKPGRFGWITPSERLLPDRSTFVAKVA